MIVYVFLDSSDRGRSRAKNNSVRVYREPTLMYFSTSSKSNRLIVRATSRTFFILIILFRPLIMSLILTRFDLFPIGSPVDNFGLTYD